MKKSFVLHLDSLCILKKMTDEQAGKLLKAIYHFQIEGELPELDFALEMAITPFINQFVRDEEKYSKIVERNQQNIGKRWNKEDTKNTTGKTGIPDVRVDTKNTDSDSDSDNKSVSVNDSKNKSKKENIFIAPTLEEVQDYFVSNGFKQEIGAKAWNYYHVGNWKDSKGAKVKNWKQKMHANWFKEEHKSNIVMAVPEWVPRPGNYWDEESYLIDCKKHGILNPPDYYAN